MSSVLCVHAGIASAGERTVGVTRLSDAGIVAGRLPLTAFALECSLHVPIRGSLPAARSGRGAHGGNAVAIPETVAMPE